MFNLFKKRKIVSSVRGASNIFTAENNPYDVEKPLDIGSYLIGSINFIVNNKHYYCEILLSKEDLNNQREILIDNIDINSYKTISNELESNTLSEGYLKTSTVPSNVFVEFLDKLKEIEILSLISNNSKVINLTTSKKKSQLTEIEEYVLNIKKQIKQLLIKIKFTDAIKKDLTAKKKGKEAVYLEEEFPDILNQYLQDNGITCNELLNIPSKYIEVFYKNILLDEIKKNTL